MGQVTIPTLTIKAMEDGVFKDQGSSYRGWLGKVLPHIGDAYRTDEDGFRSHLGASIIGDDCARRVWYNFRWATKGSFSGRMLRLFNRGHLEEGRFIALMLMCGYQVYQQDENGKQYRISDADGHFGGSGDGVVMGLPELAPGTAALMECKTHNEKSFDKLAGSNWNNYVEHLLDADKPVAKFTGEGVKASKFEHYVQANIYMRKMDLPICLYMAVNKNTDAVYFELIPLDVAVADQYLDRGRQMIALDAPPKRISETPGFWKCRFCDDRPVCHLKKPPARNCRTCSFSRPDTGGHGLWKCTLQEIHIDKATQLVGCEHYSVRKNF